MKTSARTANLIAAAAFAALPVLSQNRLSAVRLDTHRAEVRLANSDAVAGIQFSVRASSDLVLESVDRAGRTPASSWMVASYKVNDTTVNVVIISGTGSALSTGNGELCSITYHAATVSENSSIRLANVMIANPHADSLGVKVENAIWSGTATVAANSGELVQNYPNPFNPSTQIAYHLSDPAQVRLSVYDITGREVNRLVDGPQSAGDFKVTFNSTDVAGRPLASGVYFARLETGNKVSVRKMNLLK
jgi:hypothetical protein